MIYKTMKFKEAYTNYFLSKENNDLLTRLNFITTSIDGNSYIILALEDCKIVGTYAFEEYDTNNIFTLYIQVDKEYQNKGIATNLIKELFYWTKYNKKGIISSKFSEAGKKYIKNKFLEFSIEYNVPFYINEEEYQWFN